MFKNQTSPIKLDTDFNIAAATSPRILYQKPNKAKGFWVATIEGNDTLTYNPSAGDINQSGLWQFQGYAVVSGKVYYGVVVPVIVEEEIE